MAGMGMLAKYVLAALLVTVRRYSAQVLVLIDDHLVLEESIIYAFLILMAGISRLTDCSYPAVANTGRISQ